MPSDFTTELAALIDTLVLLRAEMMPDLQQDAPAMQEERAEQVDELRSTAHSLLRLLNAYVIDGEVDAYAIRMGTEEPD